MIAACCTIWPPQNETAPNAESVTKEMNDNKTLPDRERSFLTKLIVHEVEDTVGTVFWYLYFLDGYFFVGLFKALS